MKSYMLKEAVETASADADLSAALPVIRRYSTENQNKLNWSAIWC